MKEWIAVLMACVIIGLVATAFFGGSDVSVVSYSLTTDDSGDASSATTASWDGKLLMVATVPGGSPSDNWDLTLTDSNGLDLLLGNGANRDTTNTEYLNYASLGAVSNSALTAVMANGGSTKTATVYVYIETD